MSSLINDIKYGIRQLRKGPGFTLIVVLTLAIGIGAITTMFSVVNTVLLCPLPYRDPDQLVMIWETVPKLGEYHRSVSIPNFLDWQKESRSFASMAVISGGVGLKLVHDGQSYLFSGLGISSSLFATLDVQPALGRCFTPAEDQQDSEPAIVLSHRLWQSHFNADPNILGQQIGAEEGFAGHTVLGVLPEAFELSFAGYENIQFWKSLGGLNKSAFIHRGNRISQVVARLKPGISLAQAQSEMHVIAEHMASRYEENKGHGVHIVGLLEHMVKDVNTMMWILLGAVGVLLLLVCANVANLLLTKISGREREIAVRTALGANSWRLMHQVFVESLLLASLGGALGFLLAIWGNKLLCFWLGGHIPRMQDLSMDARVLGFTVLVSLLVCIGFGLAPALRLLGREILPVLQHSAGKSTSSRYCILQDALVVLQISLALVLLAGAGLLGRSFVSLVSTDLGMKPENILTFSIEPGGAYDELQTRAAFLTRLENGLQSLPGVSSVGFTNALPFTWEQTAGFSVTDGLRPQPGVKLEARYQAVSPRYFQTIGIRLVNGRFFNEHDTQSAQGKVIINETMARRFWPHQVPLGSRISISPSYGDGSPSSYEIVGIVADTKQQTIQGETVPEMSWLSVQHPPWYVACTLRTKVEPLSILESVRQLVGSLDTSIVVHDVGTLQQRISGTLTRERFSLFLYGFFAIVALLLASLGIYGVMAYAVSLRQQEIGIRIALGAQRGDVIGLILKKGCLLASIGTAFGFLGALAVTRMMGSMLYQIKALDPLTFAVVPFLLGAVTLLACYVPARRAAKVDPMEALRYE